MGLFMMISGLSALQAAVRTMEVSAINLAHLQTPDYQAHRTVWRETRGSGVMAEVQVLETAPDIVAETVTQLHVRRLSQAALVNLRTASEILGERLDRRA